MAIYHFSLLYTLEKAIFLYYHNTNSKYFFTFAHTRISTNIMKQYTFLLLLCLFPFMIGLANTTDTPTAGIYKVTASSSLRVRQAPNTNGAIMGQKMAGEKIEVTEINNGWAQINYNGQVGYVSAQYIEYLSPSPTQSTSKQWNWENLFKGSGDRETGAILLIVILVLSLITYLIRRSQNDKAIDNQNFGYYTYIGLLFITYAVEIGYQLVMGSDSIWFCSPKSTGWLWCIINFIIFGIVVYNQIMCLFLVLDSILWNAYSSLSFRWGYFYGIGICGIACIVCGFFFQSGIPFALGAMGICQLIQLGIIIKEVGSSGGFSSTILCILMYIIGTAATLIILVQFVFLLIIVLIGWLLLSAFANGSSSIDHSDDGLKKYRLPDGTEITQDSPNSDVGFHDNSGRHWDQTPGGNFRRRY
ncbi:SH3 domain-containing protein [Bacteroides oleiciplenus]|uniref:SH3 domain-containing protein n=2 Tax=Bacteroides oleiciplenus TaxID=626931 RepID=A0A3E5B2X2_9BACE|nr:SH3 domain-containing protein [Bacteroides oleiciplenus]